MANDAKLGLVLGVGVVLVIGLVFFRNDALPANSSPQTVQIARPAPSVHIESPQNR
jgi:hypothetical protein